MANTYIPALRRIASGFLRFPLPTSIEVAVKCLSRYRVQGGPFKGMIYHSPTLPMLLGTYEMETYQAIEHIRNFEVKRVINIGAAAGFYAIGFARLFPNSTIHAFEMVAEFAEMMRQNAARNSVLDHIISRGICTVTDLAQLTESPGLSLVVIDVEGAELDLLDMVKAPGLEDSLVFVELHDIHQPGCAENIRDRFRETHDIHEFFTRGRELGEFPFFWMKVPPLAWIPRYRKALVDCMGESRPGPQNWFLMIPKDISGGRRLP